MTVQDALDYGFDHVAVATGAGWRRDGVARWHTTPIGVDPAMDVLTPDDLMAGRRPAGRRVVLFDDDHYYLGGVLAELLAAEGHEVHLVTSAAQVSAWTANTLEIVKVARRVLEAGVHVHTARAVTAVRADHVETACVYTGTTRDLPADGVVLVTARLPHGQELVDGFTAAVTAGQLRSVRAIGDAWAPGTIAMAVWSGRRFAEELDIELPPNDVVPFRREVTGLSQDV
jgi:dimethylamine/trimethylamine dehydrogenase